MEVKVVIDMDGVHIVECPSCRTLMDFTLDDIAEILEFRYATPWNKSKDILEKLTIITEDIANACKNIPTGTPTKDEVITLLKLRMEYHGTEEKTT